MRQIRGIAFVICSCLLLFGRANAQDIEPRRWTPLSPGVSVIGVGYGYTEAEIFFDPVLRIEDAEFDGHTAAISYVRSFSVAGKSARVDVLLPWQNMHWQGLLDGQPAETGRVGLADPRIRLSMILAGAPSLPVDELSQYVASRPVNTVFGAAVSVTVPWGEYFEEKLLNLGQNRVTIRPQIGVVHTRGPWSYELTGSTFFFGENDDFFGGSKLEQKALYAVQAHVIRVIRPGLWASLSAGYGWAGRSELDGQLRNDDKGNFLGGLSFGFPVGSRQGVKIAYIRGETGKVVGSDSDSLIVAWSMRY
ncbi:MAG: transporter [Woeseiaceae bacterium]